MVISLLDENWKDVIGYEDNYLISDMGRIISKRGNSYKLLKQKKDKDGYFKINLSSNCKSKTFLVHRLVVTHFIGYTEKLNITNHKNSIRTDNRICNLEICDYSYNNKYAYDYGHKKKMYGTSHPKSKCVVQIDLNGNYISEFISITEASDKMGCRGRLKVNKIGSKLCINKGYVFMFKKEYERIKNKDGSIPLAKFRDISTIV